MLRPGGRLALAWNQPDPDLDWVRRMDDITGAARRRIDRRKSPAAGGPFGSVQTATFPHAYPLTRDSLAALIQTFSYYLLLDPAHRAELLRRVDELVRDHPDLAGRDTFELPYLTRCWRAHRG